MVTRTEHALRATPITTMADYVADGGLQALTEARRSDPSEVIDVIEAAGIRGRGGAGFPAGRKWRSIAASVTPADHAFVVINGAEGEPGTFKDRALLRSNPFLVLEGALIAAHVIGAERVVFATKARYETELALVRNALAELADAAILGDLEVLVLEGPDHYLYGEETAMLEVIEGNDPLPRHLPPYQYGLFTTSPQLGWSAGVDESPGGPTEHSDNPSLVNNVETFAHAALALRHGAPWYRAMGTEASPGPTIVTVTGDVQRPAVAEIELGAPLIDVIEELSGGALPGRSIKAVLSGVSNRVLTASALDAPVTHEHLAAVAGGLGSAGFIVYDDTRNMVDVAYQVSRFLHVESCGQCNPCKTGTLTITAALEKLVLGVGVADDAVRAIDRTLATVTDASRCYLPSQERIVIASLLERFSDDFAVRLGGQTGDPDVPLPKLVDLVDGTAVLDQSAVLKRGDWTYGETRVWFSR